MQPPSPVLRLSPGYLPSVGRLLTSFLLSALCWPFVDRLLTMLTVCWLLTVCWPHVFACWRIRFVSIGLRRVGRCMMAPLGYFLATRRLLCGYSAVTLRLLSGYSPVTFRLLSGYRRFLGGYQMLGCPLKKSQGFWIIFSFLVDQDTLLLLLLLAVYGDPTDKFWHCAAGNRNYQWASRPVHTLFNFWLAQWYTHTPVNMVHPYQITAIFALSYLPSCLAWVLVLLCLACIIVLLASPCQLVPTRIPLLDLFLYIREKNVHSNEELILICTKPWCFRAWLSNIHFSVCFKDFLYMYEEHHFLERF